MLDFPNSPTVGQQYSAGTKTWEWNGVAWDAVSISDALVARAETAADEAQAVMSAIEAGPVLSVNDQTGVVVIPDAKPFANTTALAQAHAIALSF